MCVYVYMYMYMYIYIYIYIYIIYCLDFSFWDGHCNGKIHRTILNGRFPAGHVRLPEGMGNPFDFINEIGKTSVFNREALKEKTRCFT